MQFLNCCVQPKVSLLGTVVQGFLSLIGLIQLEIKGSAVFNLADAQQHNWLNNGHHGLVLFEFVPSKVEDPVVYAFAGAI